MLEKFDDEGVPSAFLRFVDRGPIKAEIEYVDYVVARNMMSTLDSWVEGVEQSKKNKYLTYTHRYSYWIPRLSRLLLLFFFYSCSIFFCDKSNT
mgnify:CR=1 FL=1